MNHGLHVMRVAGIDIMAGWWLSWLYSTARDRAQSALEQALKTLQTSESRLIVRHLALFLDRP